MKSDILLRDVSIPYGVYMTCVIMHKDNIIYGCYGTYDIKLENSNMFKITNSLDETTQWLSYKDLLDFTDRPEKLLPRNRVKTNTKNDVRETIKCNIKDISE